MTAGTVADLLADLIGAPGDAWAAPTPANAANPANRQQTRVPAPGRPVCEALRNHANLKPLRVGAEPDSQTFVAFRRLTVDPQSKHLQRSSQDSQDSQGVPTPKPLQRCADCLHLLPRGTCAEPVAAGLAVSFGIRWAPDGYAVNCEAFASKAPTKAQDRPFRLSADEGDRCHAPSWDDAEIARFQDRQARFARLGIGTDDADDLAERLVLRDRTGDERAMCCECSHYRPGRCGNHRAALLQSAEVGHDLAATLQRCAAFKESR